MKLKYVAAFTPGGTPSTDDPSNWDSESGDGVAWVAISDMSTTARVKSTRKLLTSKGVRSKGLAVGHVGTVLFAMYASVGAVSHLGIPATWNQAILGINAIRDRADNRFIAYWLKSLAQDFGSITRTSTQDNLNADQVANLPFSTKPLDEQRRIADFLDDQVARIDSIVAARQKQSDLVVEESDARAEAVFESSSSGDRPLATLTDPRRPIQYGIVLPGPHFEGGVPIVKGGDVVSGRLRRSELNCTDPAIEARYPRSRLRAGDFVIAIRGSVGEVEEVPDGLDGANLTQDTARIAALGCDSLWLRMALGLPSVQSDIRSRITGATIPGINIEALRKVRVPHVRRENQALVAVEANREIDRAIAHRESLIRSNSLLIELKRSLITAAVTGDFDVTAANGSRVEL